LKESTARSGRKQPPFAQYKKLLRKHEHTVLLFGQVAALFDQAKGCLGSFLGAKRRLRLHSNMREEQEVKYFDRLAHLG